MSWNLKRILLLSDTHSYTDIQLNPYLAKADEIWHAGDFGCMEVVDWLDSFGKTLRGVYGNIDYGKLKTRFPEDNIFMVEDVKVWMTHIGGYPSRYTSRVRKLFSEIQPMLFVCGHSHIVKLEQDPKYKHWVFNPGAAGNQGFHLIKTALSFEISENNISKVEVINLGKR